jgi:hypothetical protein
MSKSGVHRERAVGRLSNVAEAQWHNPVERLPGSLTIQMDFVEDPVPGGHGGVVADEVKSVAEGLHVRITRGLGPGRARLEHEWRAAQQAVGVSEGFGVVLGEADLVKLGLGRDGDWQDKG